jgi:hypothetical protein
MVNIRSSLDGISRHLQSNVRLAFVPPEREDKPKVDLAKEICAPRIVCNHNRLLGLVLSWELTENNFSINVNATDQRNLIP